MVVSKVIVKPCNRNRICIISLLIIGLTIIPVYAEPTDTSEEGFWSFFSGLFDWLFPKDNQGFTFKNPVYKVNTSCELAYWIQDNTLKKGNWVGMEITDETFMKIFRDGWIDAQVEVWNEEFGDDYGKVDKNQVSEAMKDTGSDPLKSPTQGFQKKLLMLSPHEQELFMQKVEPKMWSLSADKIVRENSINPVFKDDVLGILKIGMLSGNGNPYVTYLLETHKYSEDLECGKKYHKYFGDETFKIMEQLWGKDFALQRHQEIQDTLYGSDSKPVAKESQKTDSSFKSPVESEFISPSPTDLNDDHDHASILVRIFGDKFDFSLPTYQNKSSWIYFEDQDGNTIHRHANEIPLSQLFDSLDIKLTDDCFVFPDGREFCSNKDYLLKFYINHHQVHSINDYVIEDEDRILISYGNENTSEIESHLKELDSQTIIG